MDFSVKQKTAVTNNQKSPLEQTTPSPGQFFYTMKKLTLAGYYTSEIGFSQELGKTIIPSGHASCAPIQEETR